MLKMVIADDEYRVLQLIKKLVQWDELGIACVGEADNGAAALDLIVSQSPDIVITDIRMPGIDGLELVRKTHELGLSARFILVSGHKQFEYAQSALRYGVEDYLVKPINKGELNAILARIRDRTLEESGRLESDRLLKTQLERNREKLRLQFMRSLVLEPDRLAIQSIPAIDEEYQLSFSPGAFLGFAVKVDRKSPAIDDAYLSRMAEKIPSLVKTVLQPDCADLLIYPHGSLVVCLANSPHPDAIRARLGLLFDEIRKHLEIHSDLMVTLAAGSYETEPVRMAHSVQAAIEGISARISLGADRVIDGAALKFSPIQRQEIFTTAHEDQFVRLLETLDVDAIEGWLNGLFAEMDPRKEIHPRVMVDVCLAVLNAFSRAVARLGLDPDPSFGADPRSRLENAVSFAELQATLTALVRGKLDSYLQARRIQDARPIRLAKQFVSEHFAEPICLEEVAQEVHLNPAYFSAVFKKEVGINFSDYLMKCRVEKAKDLLKNTHATMTEISEKVGYKDPKYLSKIFLKIVGMTPGEYRKLYS